MRTPRGYEEVPAGAAKRSPAGGDDDRRRNTRRSHRAVAPSEAERDNSASQARANSAGESAAPREPAGAARDDGAGTTNPVTPPLEGPSAYRGAHRPRAGSSRRILLKNPRIRPRSRQPLRKRAMWCPASSRSPARRPASDRLFRRPETNCSRPGRKPGTGPTR